jgi:RES domain-containing protein
VLAAWRIIKSRHASTAFRGEGARLFGGRWNSPGIAVVYASESRALAMLEVLAGLGEATHLGAYVLIGAHFDQALLATIDPEELPDNWRAYPPPAAVQAIGDRWVRESTSAILAVPSVLVPAERNYLLNPAHAAFSEVAIGPPQTIPFDLRLMR